ncbi:alkane 1-monooxygenase [Tropicibacter naphthalenivorans]|uniref:Alkane 1-monooxygenase 2 n=1 Tax=Tropicibacter naphthalenivorans TaxID=441103 RepID=A0A0P1G417_9RHOB|nr:alkane 1-monooxygenase [Tropicibacter naphthalenivorans]CUH76436.1 Alkane 1-monooxygenase 2 [Tropicibacter naphthalenivorans]SMC66175.1 alkane 1-monooxygenase [Tropicibacter naphthalenivorans]
MARFALVTLGMVALLFMGLAWGGPWALAALLYITVFTFFMDKVTALAQVDHPGAEFPSGNGLSVVLALVHFPLLFGGVWRLGGDALTTLDKVLMFLALSLFFGQVSNSNAHELIHRSARGLRRLGVAVYASVLFGHHASAHVRVHHVHAATDADPNSARLGESFYAFAWRAWRGALREGYRAESRLRAGRGVHPYVWYGLGALASLGLAYALGQGKAVLWLLGLSAYAQVQLFLSDYVQHYGLRRLLTPQGKPEPVGPQHSWNAPHGFSSALMLNAPRHSDHHARPARPYPGLEIDRHAMPILPQSLPVMAVLALVPPVWRRVMDKRAARWAEPRPS